MKALVMGTGRAVPDKVLTNAELEEMVDTTDEWIMERTGIRERRIAAADESLSDFALPAAERALESAGISGSEVDLVICATVSPDMYFPATATVILRIPRPLAQARPTPTIRAAPPGSRPVGSRVSIRSMTRAAPTSRVTPSPRPPAPPWPRGRTSPTTAATTRTSPRSAPMDC